MIILGSNPSSVCLRVRLSGTNGNGLTGLTYQTAGLSVSVIKAQASATSSYTALAGTIEAVGTCGTYVLPDTGKVRFGEVNPTALPGLYELQFSDTVWVSTHAVDLTITGASGLVDYHEQILTSNVQADVEAIATQTVAATNLSTSAMTMEPGAVDAFVFTPTTTQFQSTLTDSQTGTYVGRVLIFTSGLLIRQARTVNGYQLVGGRGQFVTDPFTQPPADGDSLIVL